MADFVQGLDPSKLVLAEIALTFTIAAFSSPAYNLPIFLFGLYAQENTEAVLSLQAFSALVGASVIADIIWLSRNSQNWFVKLVSILILVLKLPTFVAFASALRSRGGQFSGLGGLGTDNLSGPTLWSMPGGFTSSGGRDGYQTVDDPEPATARPPAPPVSHAPPAAPGGYQGV
ncbi:hypothetical protein FA95DRAFT_1186724 [Auriscalpium vulgare]|uniref:Uncharacterized protein n=1 Tax=Auriscalpium vulgare TaxID=40419 RepID=A0ACB8RUV1_9AGAM|nr:hypothetical protein FA95DRAFT_1186724 [Auriscalpium vulgare]